MEPCLILDPGTRLGGQLGPSRFWLGQDPMSHPECLGHRRRVCQVEVSPVVLTGRPGREATRLTTLT